MSISPITAYPPWSPVSSTGSLDATQNLDCFSMASTGTTTATSSGTNSVSGSSDPFQQLDASLQAMLLQMQSGAGTGTTQAIGQSGSIQADADTLVQAIEQSLSSSASTTATTTAEAAQTTATSSTDPSQTQDTQGTQGHHHHHHHMSDGDGGSNNGTNNSSATNTTANSLVADITQAIQSYGAPSTAASG